MREFFEWMDATPIGGLDLIVSGSLVLAVWLYWRVLNLSGARAQRRQAILDARVSHAFIKMTFSARRYMKGVDPREPELQNLMLGTITSWRDGHPEEVKADIHGDPFVCQAMEEIEPRNQWSM